MRKLNQGGGWAAVWYSLRIARQAGGIRKFFRALRSPNACKTCALGMGGQRGGMVDESGRFPEVCKKSMQAMAADMQGAISPAFFVTYSLNELAAFTPRDLEHMGRLVCPVIAEPGDSHYRPISWDQAIDRAVHFLKATPPAQSFFYSSGRSSNEAAFAMQLFARLHGTNHVNNCSYYCHQASGVGLSGALGTGTATIVLEDLESCDTVFLIGGNPASNHPRLMRALMKLRRRGGEVIVVNPIRETGLVRFAVPSDLRSLLFGSSIASLYIQPHIGGDIAFLCGVAKWIEESKLVDESFLASHTEGAGDFRRFLASLSWPEIESASGVPLETIVSAARRYALSQNTIFAWTMGITHHLHGVDNVRAIVNLALLRGMVGRPNAGLLPIRGHSNVQGVGSMGVTPRLPKAVQERLQHQLGLSLPTTPGFDTLSCLEAMHAGNLRTGWCLGGNLYGASPDSTRAHEAFGRLESLVYFSTTLNTGHVHGRAATTLILPMLVRDEEAQATTQESMFSFVRLSAGGLRRHDGPRSEVETVATVARRVLGDGGPVDWASMLQHRTIRKAISEIVPGYEQAGAMDQTRKEFQVGGRTFHQPRFATPTGRARFQAVRIPPSARTNGQLMLMTIRSEGQFNTVVYEEEDIYRHQERRNVILMNPADIARLGLRVDQRVTVASSTGRMIGILVRECNIRSGNAAMYYPEANALVAAAADPESRTPAFKSVSIHLYAETSPPWVNIELPRPKKTGHVRRPLNAC